MSADMPDRPADLRRSRRPVPAADEQIDPVDYRADRAPEPALETPSAPDHAIGARSPSDHAPVRSLGSRRDTALPFSTRLAPEVLDLIDRARAAGEGDGKVRHVVEKAIRDTYGAMYGHS